MRWYKPTGELFTEQIEMKKGGLRDVNLRDARKLGLVPSVTSILDILAKPGLLRWKEGKLIVGTLDFTDNYIQTHKKPPPLDLAKDYVYEQFQQEMDKTTGFGTRIHGAIELWLTSKEKLVTTPDDVLRPFLDPLYKFLKDNDIKGTSEKSFAGEIDGMGYAGTLDLVGDGIISDFKTQDTKGTGKFVSYPESLYQLAGYKLAMPDITSVRNIYISSTELGVFKIKEYKPEELAKAEEIFRAVLKMFYLMKGL